MIYTTKSPEETYNLGVSFGKQLKSGDAVAFIGGMGMGKTTFTRGVGVGIGYDGDVSSPTFALVNEYLGNFTLYHFDMYRITSADDLFSTGFYDHLDEGSSMIIEWSENIKEELPEDIITIEITGDLLNYDLFNIRNFNIKGGRRFENLSY